MLYRFVFMTETTLLIALPVSFCKIILCENYTAFKVPKKYFNDHTFESVSARLALKWVREQGVAVLCAGSRVNYSCISVHRPIGALMARRQVNDPPACCGAASTTLCGGRGDPHPSWASSSVESGIKVTVIVFMEETWLPLNYSDSYLVDDVECGGSFSSVATSL